MGSLEKTGWRVTTDDFADISVTVDDEGDIRIHQDGVSVYLRIEDAQYLIEALSKIKVGAAQPQ